MTDENRNFILAAVLCVAVLVGWQYFFVTPPEPVASTDTEQTLAADAAGTPAPADGSGLAPVPDTTGKPQVDEQLGGAGLPVAASAVLPRAIALEQSPRVTLDSPSVDGSISLTGARIDDLQLKNYRQTVDPTSPEIILLSPRGSENPYYAEFGWTAPASANVSLPGADTVWTQDTPGMLTPTTPITLSYDNGAGLTFRKTISLDEDYMFTIEQSVDNATAAAVTLYPYGLVARTGTPEIEGIWILHEGLIGYFPDTDGLQELDYDDLQETGSIRARTAGGWLGITDKYWMTALIPDQSTESRMSFSDTPVRGQDVYQADYLRDPVVVPAGGSTSTTDRLFAGAKVVNIIDGYEGQLGIESFELAIDWGWFYFFTKPLFLALLYIQGMVGNFGVAIIIITVLIKLAFFPLANTSYVAMSKMKKVQPEMMKLRERFADDKQRQQQELMELYKREKVNPLAGCLPILIQIPVFFALYKVLFVTIEMRHAPFFGWINDLSAQDPTSIFNLFGLIPFDPPSFLLIGVWPILMGITMYLQMKMNPAPTDEIQQQIFRWMPIIFTFVLATFPAGLVIYWTFNNAFSILQQWVIMRRQGVSPEWGQDFQWLTKRFKSDNDAS
ncbi:Inner membrane protein translocase component YidC, long form [Candidatus Phaeomarinobacter ectocarpi]|uniref:Membrane protein insertase YidC n=1 Tax=Candidatus Phaeomarinibacter ectocarpi TaxID=1458461 RepID=X5MK59_9HYPH|nr:membrane protein insertase YidC [Candidatus Phaeomarinobacter ectocarpi]CDO58270.1 Inner membrane protein translocase component YidC, long form [Candidatus Phaeomarinobacter ectocarpi]